MDWNINFQICQCFFRATVLLYTVHCAVNIGLSTTTHFLYSTGRYLFLNAIANQLRYPNSHTHYFSCALLSLFAEANTEAVQEQITRFVYSRATAISLLTCNVGCC